MNAPEVGPATSKPTSLTRVEHWDVARGIGILLVMLGHLEFSPIQVNLIYFFHMPLFLFLSGIFHRARPWREEAERVLWLWLSILFYGVIFSLLAWIIQKKNPLGYLDELSFLTPLGIWSIPYFGVFWFLVALLIVRVIARLLAPLSASPLCFFGLGTLLFFTAYSGNVALNGALGWLPLCLGPALMLLFFYQAGSLSPQIESAYTPLRLLLAGAFYLLAALVYILAWKGLEDKIVNYHHMQVFNSMAAFAFAIVGTITLSWLAIGINRHAARLPLFSRMLVFAGRYSFHFFAWHLFAFAMTQLLARSLGFDPAGRKVLFLAFWAALAVGYASVKLQSRLEPRMPRAFTRLLYLR